MIWLSYDVSNPLVIDKFYSFFEVHYDEGYHFHGETHNFWECVYVQDGSICVSGDERVYQLEKGTIIFHKPMELHKLWANTASGATLLIFSFSLEGPLAPALKDKVFLLSDDQKGIISSMLDYVHRKIRLCEIPADTSPCLKYLLPFGQISAYSQMLTTYVYQLFLSLIGDGTISSEYTTPESLIFGKAVSYMNHQISSQISVSEIAHFCNTSESTLKRIFAKYSGISIHKYFVKLKIKTAAEFLKNGISVTETAEKLGFSSQAYFSAAFKREFGVSPSKL